MSLTKQASLHGRRAYVAAEGPLTGKDGVASGGEGKGVVVYPAADIASMYDDFMGEVIADQWIVNEGTDTGAHATQAIVSGASGGQVKLLSGTGYASFAEVMASINGGKHWKANQGQVRMTARVKIPTVTSISAFVGFTDDTGTAEAPIWEDTGSAAQVSTATDAVGFLFDTANGHTAWQAVGSANGVDVTPVDLASGPTANVWETLEVVLDTGGDARFYRNGALVAGINDCVTPTVGLTPVLSVWPHSTAARALDADFVAVSGLRDTGA